MQELRHAPVLLSEMLEALAPRDGALYVDATFGGGGYSRAILASARCHVIGIDRDPAAVERGEAMAHSEPRFAMRAGPFSDLRNLLGDDAVAGVDGIVMDLGVSSFQLDDPERGFSFRHGGPLDMRMSRAGPSAADLVAESDEQQLVDIFRRFGEEQEARRVANAIVARRMLEPFVDTADLAACIAGAKRRHKPGRDPATAVFQALRIAVNDELGEVERGLEAAVGCLRPGSRLVVVAFHSLEDRIVKRFVDAQGGRVSRPSRHLPLPTAAEPPRQLGWLSRRVVKPTAGEIERNPRARSARLRVAVRLAASRDEDETPAGDRVGWRLAA